MRNEINWYEVNEAIRLGRYADYEEYILCWHLANVYGCVPLQTDGDNLYRFLQTLYHYGRIQGIRQERARRKRGQQPCSVK